MSMLSFRNQQLLAQAKESAKSKAKNKKQAPKAPEPELSEKADTEPQSNTEQN